MTLRGETWAARRRRSEGPLDGGELALARAQGVALAYDPAQAGWVPATCRDDLAPPLGAPLALAFRPWEEADAPAFRALLDDPEVWRFLPESHRPLSEDDARALIALSAAPHHEVRAVLADGRPVGQVRLLRGPEGEAELSYWLGRGHWGRGLGSALVARAAARAFADHPRLRALTARVHEGNPASARALEKAGFAEEGRDGPWRWFRLRRPVPAVAAGRFAGTAASPFHA